MTQRVRGGTFRVGASEYGYLCVGIDVVTPASELTAAEAAIARLAANGRSSAEIARIRRVSTRTVANQLASIYRKLGIASRIELAARLYAGRDVPARAST